MKHKFSIGSEDLAIIKNILEIPFGIPLSCSGGSKHRHTRKNKDHNVGGSNIRTHKKLKRKTRQR